MKRKIRFALLICAAALLAAGAALYVRSGREPEAGADEILLKIRLDLGEDIWLLVIHHSLDGEEGSGGICNADRTMLKRDDTLYWSFDRQFYPGSGDTVDMILRFRVVTEYFEPNYENIYPEEYVVPLEAVSFRADFGGTYLIRITGDRNGGYKAVPEGQD